MLFAIQARLSDLDTIEAQASAVQDLGIIWLVSEDWAKPNVRLPREPRHAEAAQRERLLHQPFGV